MFGDPATPLFESYAGDPVTIRLVTPAERRRSHTFHLHGHRWRFDTKDINSRTESFVGFNVAGATRNLELLGGAGAYGNFLEIICTVLEIFNGTSSKECGEL